MYLDIIINKINPRMVCKLIVLFLFSFLSEHRSESDQLISAEVSEI